MQTFILNGRVIVSPNMSIPPPAVCRPPIKGEDEDEALSYGHLFCAMSPDYPQLPFSLPHLLRHGPLFSCLDYNKKSLPIVRVKSLYQLRPDLLDKWIALDDFLTDVFNVLGVMAPMNVVLTLVPRETNYGKPRETEKAARGAASHALHRFQHLICLTSWSMSGYKEGIDRPDPQWVKVLLEKGFPPAMVEMLRDSPVGTFSLKTPRVGTVVNPFDEQCVIRVRRMVEAHVPIYIFWGHCNPQGKRNFQNLPDTWLPGKWVRENCYPSDEDLARAIALALAPVQRPVPLRPLPDPPRGSRQRKGETWQHFFARQETSNKEKEARETSKEKAARQQRDRNALRGRVPGRKGAAVFQWESVHGFRLRINIGHSTANQIWVSYPGGQKRYDPFTDEWDVCTEFDPTAPSEFDILEVDSDSDEGGQHAPLPMQPNSAPTPNPSAHRTATFVGDEIPQSESSGFPALDDVLQQRYGFVYSHATRLVIPPSNSNSITELAMKVCEGRAPSPMSTGLRDAAVAFLGLLVSGQPLDSVVCDMLDGSLEDEYKSGHIAPASCHFVISLDDPVAVLQIIRAQPGPDLPDVALQLASRGISFGTRTVSETVPIPTVSYAEPPVGLGFLPFHYQPLPSDYLSYLDKRDRLLRRSYGRAALMKGGIIARLARDSLGDRMDVLVQGGPSESVFKYGTAIRVGQEYLWDDDLDSNDEQVICGVYKISTGQRDFSLGEQTSDVSWWPKQSTWEVCGLNVGYWSADDEVWFQKHLEDIRNYRGAGPPPYHSAAEWRNRLKYHKATRKVVASTRDAAGKWLSSIL
ncbi:hypothetical protein J3R83DRAFT_11747 [Lanmaoa asiatica]|nr:hypothetical protein J3R83DRAFT_11747 [Lanmaoa asiatica]